MAGSRIRTAWCLIAAMLLALFAQPALAHLTPNSEITLTVQSDEVVADIIIPRSEYAYASGNGVSGDAASLRAARAYLSDRFALSGADSDPWPRQIESLRFAQVQGPPDLLARVRFTPTPPKPGRFDLRWSAVIDEVPDHFALVVVKSAGDSRVIGALRHDRQEIAVDPVPSSWAAFTSAVSLGAIHIAEGYDHLLFLLALLLAAPLIARGSRWDGIRTMRGTFSRLVRITLGFTLGHSATLVLAGLTAIELPSAPVEAAIAFSVILTAVHAIRPIFPGREAWVSIGFGLIHGLAFATLLAETDAQMAQNLPSLLGFNLGIELVQLAVLAVAVPPLMLLARRPRFSQYRTAAAVGIALCGSWWLVQRVPPALALALALTLA